MKPILFALLLAAANGATHADEGRSAVALLPAYKAECGSCHVAFPPRLLPAESWQRLMGGLPKHFGVDASLDAAPQKAIADWLQAHAGGARKRPAENAAPPEDRITRGAWFQREHDEVAADAWKRPAIKSASNCGACHTQAEQGDFSERNIRIPR
ncbi:Ni,Fe-hydrogenase I cytochrome b subunit [Rubrivivax sp. A210]|uniref:diheme cytochrome c n=1 Tax=Rubrivivax sp. A210 TaxID=2772301 RepID=UPI0019A4EFCF|nr:diheme cytochrome c [Rubrivivax sp. A210]CAD5374356.1 Ni,Fe-hydrogenase I cytochrome b subunit [Rubrivivax sp. A210]